MSDLKQEEKVAATGLSLTLLVPFWTLGLPLTWLAWNVGVMNFFGPILGLTGLASLAAPFLIGSLSAKQ